MKFERHFSGEPWEKTVGYCRAIRVGSIIHVSGTAPVGENGKTYRPDSPYHQAKRCLELIGQTLVNMGSGLPHVFRTRMFVTDISLWEEFGRAHAEVFGSHPPTTSMVEVSGLIAPDMMIEIEAEAVLPEPSRTPSRGLETEFGT